MVKRVSAAAAVIVASIIQSYVDIEMCVRIEVRPAGLFMTFIQVNAMQMQNILHCFDTNYADKENDSIPHSDVIPCLHKILDPIPFLDYIPGLHI